MGRKRKHGNKNSLIGIIILIIAVLAYVKLTFFKDYNPLQDININLKNPFQKEQVKVNERSTTEDMSAAVDTKKIKEQDKNSIIKKDDVFATVFFAKTSNDKDIYIGLSRKVPASYKGSQVKYAVKMLLAGPTRYEHKKGVYSEVPSGTKLLSYKETPNKIIINLSDDFEYGGGGDSLYKRMYQLIKTVNHNTKKPVYLYLNGKQADMIGGEGLMLKQPLRSNSLDE